MYYYSTTDFKIIFAITALLLYFYRWIPYTITL
jgi:hypothetical protein